MGPGMDDQSRDSIDSLRLSRRDFSILRSRKRELLDEQRTGWVEGRPIQPEDLMGRWPTNPESDPDAASLLLEDYLQRRRRDEQTSLVEYERRFPEHKRSLEGLVAKETVFRSITGRESDDRGSSLRLPDVGG